MKRCSMGKGKWFATPQEEGDEGERRGGFERVAPGCAAVPHTTLALCTRASRRASVRVSIGKARRGRRRRRAELMKGVRNLLERKSCC